MNRKGTYVDLSDNFFDPQNQKTVSSKNVVSLKKKYSRGVVDLLENADNIVFCLGSFNTRPVHEEKALGLVRSSCSHKSRTTTTMTKTMIPKRKTGLAIRAVAL